MWAQEQSFCQASSSLGLSKEVLFLGLRLVGKVVEEGVFYLVLFFPRFTNKYLSSFLGVSSLMSFQLVLVRVTYVKSSA